VKARKIYKFLWGWRWGLPKVSTGRVWLRPTGYAGPKSSFESPHLPPKTLCARRERPAWDAGRKVVFRIPLQPL